MKLEIASKNFALALTIAEWETLRAKEDYRENKGIYLSLDWGKKFDISDLDWNGHFGRYIFFTATDEAAEQFEKFLKRFLVVPENFKKGLWDGESGAEQDIIKGNDLQKNLYKRGYECGSSYGRNKSLTAYQKDLDIS